MIVQELTRLQREHGFLRESDVRASAAAVGVPLYRFWEVASFFPHFRTQPPRKVTALVCQDMSCRLRGACDLIDAGQNLGVEEVQVTGVSCLGRCDRAPAALINDDLHVGRTVDEFVETLQGYESGARPTVDHDADCEPPLGAKQKDAPWTIDVYNGAPKYEAVRAYVADREPSPQRVIKALETAGLLGMGGAGGRAYKKWSDVLRAEGEQKYVVCNADESEPGTFKDRDLLLRAPWLILEGMILGGLVVGADRGYVYIRHEYHEQIEAVRAEIESARRAGSCGESIFGSGFEFDLEVFESPGGYICGEQTALIEAMEDHRAEPRNRPPQLQTNGLWDKPTLLSNVETFAWAPTIVLNDNGQRFAEAGRPGMKGRRFFSISGDLERPGAYEVPIGITLGELIEDYAGGVVEGREMYAVAPSGPSGGFLPRKLPINALSKRFAETLPKGASHFDLFDWKLDIGVSRQMGLMLGAGIVVYAEGTDIVDQAWACSRFYRDESCGKCVPCRIGSQKITEWIEKVRDRTMTPDDLDEASELFAELGDTMTATSICGLGQVASAPVITLLRFFREEVVRHLSEA